MSTADTSGFADTLFLNGIVLTMDGENAVAEAVAVRGDRILAVGNKDQVAALAGPATRTVDLQGRTLMPGLIDAHGHFPGSGMLKLFNADLRSPPVGTVTDIDGIVSVLQARAAVTDADWVMGRGYDDTLIKEHRHPTRHDLDRVSTERPVFIAHVSGHLGVANTKALELAGLTAATPEPEGGVIRREADGYPDGVLEEPPAMKLVSGLIPEPGLDDSLAAIAEAGAEYAALGVTSAQNSWAEAGLIAALAEAERRGGLPIRITALPSWPLALEIKRGTASFDLPADGKLELGAAKVFADGSIQGYTGYLSKPYHVPFKGDESYRGYPIYPKEKLNQIIAELHREGFQIHIHGNGDAAIDDILDAIDLAQAAHPRDDTRHTIIHAQMSRDDQLDRMAELGVTPSFFTLHTYYWGDRHRDIFMGPERAMRMSPAAGALARGVPFTIHCDTPVVPMTPLLLAWAAVNRISTGGQVIGEAQRISPIQALRAITIDAAWQVFQEGEKGSIEPGKLADLVVLSENPCDVPERIKDIRVIETFVGGRSIYAAGRAAAESAA